MKEDGFDTDRRTLLSTTAGSAVGASGCLGRNQPAETTGSSPTTGSRQQPTRVAQKATSGRTGTTVFYDPDDRGPYADGQEALADVPDGGTFELASGVYDVATEGRLLVEKRPVYIRSQSDKWCRTADRSGDSREFHWPGTVIENRGAIDKPTIDILGDWDTTSSMGAMVRGLTIKHDTDAPAIRIKDTTNSHVVDTGIFLYQSAPVGIKYEGLAFFARANRTAIKQFTDTGIHVTGDGYSHEFYSVWSGSGAPDATALQTECHRSIIMGGEYAATADTGTAIRFYNPEESPLYGGLVFEPGIEHTARCIDIDGESPFDGVQVYGSLLSIWAQESEKYQGGGAGVRFGNARNCKLVYPVATADGNLAHWTEDAINCGIITDGRTMGQVSLMDDGSRNPYVRVNGAMDKPQIDNMSTEVPTTVDYYSETGNPVLYDGSSWKTVPLRDGLPE
jgi:hypothetical protein